MIGSCQAAVSRDPGGDIRSRNQERTLPQEIPLHMLAHLTLALVVLCNPIQPDTVLTVGEVHRDLTGDGVPERLALIARGSAGDSVEFHFTVDSSGELLYERTWTLTSFYDDSGRELSREEMVGRVDEWVADFRAWFFRDGSFWPVAEASEHISPPHPVVLGGPPEEEIQWQRLLLAKVDSVRAAGVPEADALLHAEKAMPRYRSAYDTVAGRAAWDEMLSAGVTAFGFSIGSENWQAIVWSPTDERFYESGSCC